MLPFEHANFDAVLIPYVGYIEVCEQDSSNSSRQRQLVCMADQAEHRRGSQIVVPLNVLGCLSRKVDSLPAVGLISQ